MVNKFIKSKSTLLGIGVLGAVALSSFSISAFAQSAVIGQQDVVRTEAQAPAALSGQSNETKGAAIAIAATQPTEGSGSSETAGDDAGAADNPGTYTLRMGSQNMTFAQAGPFLSKAMDALKLNTVMKSHYTVMSSYDAGTNTVTVSVLHIDPLSGSRPSRRNNIQGQRKYFLCP
jgi:hypothetical protein